MGHKIDIHTHIMPEKLPRWADKFGYKGFISLDHHKPCCARMMKDDEFFREIESNCWDAHKRMEECDHHQVYMQVLSTIPVLFHYWAKADDAYDTARFLNDHIASIVKDFPHRFTGLATLPMQSASLSVKEILRAKKIGLNGIEIGSNINDINLNERQFFEIYEAAEAEDMCVFVHPWNMMGAKNMQQYWLPWLVGMPAETSRAICSMIFGGVFERFPKLKVAFAHGGGSFPATIGRVQHGFDVRPDLTAIDNAVSPSNYLGKFFVDTLTHDPRALQYIIDLIGENRVMLGTDYPFPLGELEPGKVVEELNTTQQVKDKLLFENALEWLGIEKSRLNIK